MATPMFGAVHPPAYEKLPSKDRMDEYLYHIAMERLGERLQYDGSLCAGLYRKRLTHELQSIAESKAAPYIFIARDLVSWGRCRNIPIVGGGRSIGSLACWLLGLTPLDPISNVLSFELFLDALNKYGSGIYLYLSLDDIQETTDYIEKRLKQVEISKRSSAIEVSIKEGKPATGQASWKILLFGMPILDTIKEQLARIAIANPSGFLAVLYEKEIEKLAGVQSRRGQRKFIDLLLRCNDPVPFAPPPLFTPPLDDAASYALYASGELGEEYFHGKPWLRGYARWLRPTNFDDLTALFMPWETSDFRHERLAEYVRRRLGKDAAVDILPELSPFLEDTCGLLIYQEQAVQILHGIGGCPLDKAAECVRALPAWGLGQVLEVTNFAAGAHRRGYSPETVEATTTLISERMGYLVQKSWCASQAFASYQAVYLKAHGAKFESAPEVKNALV